MGRCLVVFALSLAPTRWRQCRCLAPLPACCCLCALLLLAAACLLLLVAFGRATQLDTTRNAGQRQSDGPPGGLQGIDFKQVG